MVVGTLPGGECPEAWPAYWEAPETLRPKWVFISGETEELGQCV